MKRSFLDWSNYLVFILQRKYEGLVVPFTYESYNLGPERLAGPKALDPNYCRQPTL